MGPVVVITCAWHFWVRIQVSGVDFFIVEPRIDTVMPFEEGILGVEVLPTIPLPIK